MSRRELILYATPAGELGAACDRYYRAAAAIGPTTAQAYPPHCTLTGFFHRAPWRSDQVIGEMATVIERAGDVPGDAVAVVELTTIDDWVGLLLESAWLADLTARIVAGHRLAPGDDPLRPKDRLHLSLAYGTTGIEPYAELAADLVDPSMAVQWEVAVWERLPGPDWVRH
jgi:ubiquitin-associated SH3 domain-containing protein